MAAASSTLQPPAPAENAAASATLRCILFDADGDDRDVAPEQLHTIEPAVNQLLWVDAGGADPASLRELASMLGFPEAVGANLSSREDDPLLRNHGDFFELRVVAIASDGALGFSGNTLRIAAGANKVITAHAEDIAFLEALRLRERGDTRLGLLDATMFVTALLDWHLGTYFDAVSAFEDAADKLETSILADRDPRLEDLRRMRKSASRLRSMLGPHRRVFTALRRADFRPEDEAAQDQFAVLDDHFERAMDMVEHARELVVGSFEMFSSRLAVRTNESMRALTFATVVIGGLAVLAGVLGMNFEVPFFRSGARGFWLSIAAMGFLLGLSIVVGKRRNWL